MASSDDDTCSADDEELASTRREPVKSATAPPKELTEDDEERLRKQMTLDMDQIQYIQQAGDSDQESDPVDPEEAERLFAEPPKEDGKYYDDPIWYGKSLDEIKYATELEKSNGNAASRDGDWKKASKYWKNAVKGAMKVGDGDTEFRLRLNLALGYTRQGKTDKALDHCDLLSKVRMDLVATPPLRAKAHYRRAEAYLEAGETPKALRSLRAVLEIEPANADARKLWAQIKNQEQDRKKREKKLFAGLIPPSEELKDPRAIEQDVEAEVLEEEARLTESLTNSEAKARLVRGLMGGGHGMSPLNFQIGQEMNFFGPRKSEKSEIVPSEVADGTA
eukprot:gnl/TRDRNA2_/TRDRNA2_191967_c0_seq1.p1 gnl/TRDRNA2_/TRDRNA2_191967_c0~~gnl/TRDRNA2_/TRDRNA2_191967_c0_seq1.p1  ORF type:complete len:335 (-),score=93.48 gnl/TRDRNA2_/TRDRNA2_191967_c0_seq1:42-1046(-)